MAPFRLPLPLVQGPAPGRSLRLAGLLLPALLGGPLLCGGCQAGGLVTASPPEVSVQHWPVTPAPPLRTADPVMLVALASRLGPAPGVPLVQAVPLVLEAARGELSLEDGAGHRVQGSRLTLHWRRTALQSPLRIHRRVLGPFASYESAQEAARGWRSRGVEVTIARPGDWEVWAAPEAPDPPAQQARQVERLEASRLVLELRGAGAAQLLQGPIRIQAPGGLLWGSSRYSGPFLLQPDAYGSWSLVEQVPLERYLQGVVPLEIGAGAPAAALAAQAVLARTWAVRNRARFQIDGYHLCADTQCQVYGDATRAGDAVRQAITSTRARVLASGGEPISAVYHASNGGIAAGFEEGWSASPLPYLKAFADGPAPFSSRFQIPLAPASLELLLSGSAPAAWGADHPLYRWQRTLTAAQIREALGEAATGVGLPTGLRVLERGASGRVLALEIRGPVGVKVLRLDAIRRTLRQLPSTLFVLAPAGPGSWLVRGGGFGHGAGMSQAGAIDLARQGWGTERILQHYYPGSELVTLQRFGEAL